MSVDIISGATSDLLTVDPTSNAARVTLYDAGGGAMLRNVSFQGANEFEIRQSATTGAGAVVWAIHNSHATTKVYIASIQVRCFFDGTAVATLMKYEIIKATSVTAFSAGTLITPVNKQTGQTAVSTIRFLDTGLTTTGITNVQVLGNIVMGRVLQTTSIFLSVQEVWDFGGLQKRDIRLAQNEIFGIRQTVTSVVGDNIIGTCDYVEAP